MKTIQDSTEILSNARAFLKYIEPTSFLLVVDPRTQTPDQLQVAQANSVAFNYWLSRNKTNAEGLTDFSVAAIRDCYKALRDAGMIDFSFGVEPVIRKAPTTLTDDRGRVVRNLKQERMDQAQRDAEEAAQPRRTFEDKMRKAERTAQVNRTIEETRAQIAAFRGPTHSKTYAIRDKATEILEKAIQNDRTFGGIATAASDVQLLMKKAWD